MPQLPNLPRRALATAAALVLALAALVVAGCGGGGGSGDEDADPAQIAPRNTLLWFTGQVRPEGSQKAAVDAIAKKVLRVNDPGKRIQSLLDREIREERRNFSYAEDIEPWLGRRAGVAVTALGAAGQNADAALIVAAKDTGKAQDAVDKLADGNTPKLGKREYEGVEYRYDPSDRSAAGVVDDYVVAGTERAFRAVVDASKGDGLTENGQYKSAARGSGDKLGFGFADTRALVNAAGAQGQLPGGAQSLQGILGAQANQPVTMALEATQRNVVLETVAGTSPQARGAGASKLLPELPGDAWFAAALPNLGQMLRQTLEQIESGVGAGLVETAQQQIRAATGLDLNRDILPTLGELAVFAQGSSVLTAGGGLVIDVPEPAAARRVLDRLQPLIRQQARGAVTVSDAQVGGGSGFKVTSPRIPGSINAVLRGDRLVVAYTDAATRRALSPRETLGDSPKFQQATTTLGGGQPSLFVDFEPLTSLAAAASAEDAAKIRQYLGAFATLVAGTRAQGDKQVGRLVVNLK